MGFGSWFSKVMHKIGGGIKKGSKAVYHVAKKATTSIIKSGVIQNLYKDAKGAVTYVATAPMKLVDKGIGFAEHQTSQIVGGAKSLGNSLSMPLVIGGVGLLGIAAVVMMKK